MTFEARFDGLCAALPCPRSDSFSVDRHEKANEDCSDTDRRSHSHTHIRL